MNFRTPGPRRDVLIALATGNNGADDLVVIHCLLPPFSAVCFWCPAGCGVRSQHATKARRTYQRENSEFSAGPFGPITAPRPAVIWRASSRRRKNLFSAGFAGDI